MIVYHGSTIVVDKPDVNHSYRPFNRIYEGEYGIQYLDYKVLVQILGETEPELLRKARTGESVSGKVREISI